MMRYALVVVIGAAIGAGRLAGQVPNYKQPEENLPRTVAPQPVPFSHKAHARIGSKCTDCHVSVEKGARASLPQADRCMLCHQAVKKESPQIRELARMRESGTRIAWVRVYKVPQFVFFNHANHRKAGIECFTCHGPVADRDVLAQEISTGMVGCMNCHAARKVSNECHFCHALGY